MDYDKRLKTDKIVSMPSTPVSTVAITSLMMLKKVSTVVVFVGIHTVGYGFGGWG